MLVYEFALFKHFVGNSTLERLDLFEHLVVVIACEEEFSSVELEYGAAKASHVD